MNNDVFKDIVKRILNACESSLLGAKHSEYTRREDRFHNFKSAAKKRNKHHIEILLDYQVKHRVSIDDICDDAMLEGIYPTDEYLLEKIKDDINYNIMLFGMIIELRDEARQTFLKGENQAMAPGKLVKMGEGYLANGAELPENFPACFSPPKSPSIIYPEGTTLTADMLPGMGRVVPEVQIDVMKSKDFASGGILSKDHPMLTRWERGDIHFVAQEEAQNHQLAPKINDPQATVESGRKVNSMGDVCTETLPETDSNPLLDVVYQRDNDLHETIKQLNKSMGEFSKSLYNGLSQDKQTGDI